MSFATARSVSIGAIPALEVYYGELKLWPPTMLSFTDFPPWEGVEAYNALEVGTALNLPPWVGAETFYSESLGNESLPPWLGAQAINSTLLATVAPPWGEWELSASKQPLAAATFPPWEGWDLGARTLLSSTTFPPWEEWNL
jgi:hypothetical protein